MHGGLEVGGTHDNCFSSPTCRFRAINELVCIETDGVESSWDQLTEPKLRFIAEEELWQALVGPNQPRQAITVEVHFHIVRNRCEIFHRDAIADDLIAYGRTKSGQSVNQQKQKVEIMMGRLPRKKPAMAPETSREKEATTVPAIVCDNIT